jgi:RNA polymerase sigma-70 factor (ECF subfamily)
MEEKRDNPALLDRPLKTTLSSRSSGLSASDLDLLQSSAKGDSAAFRELVDRHSEGLFRLAQWLSGNRADAEDVLQETFTGAFKSMSRFAGRASVKTWLTQILIRQASKMRHRRGRMKIAAPPDPSGGGSGREGEPWIGAQVTTVDRRIDLAAMIQKLPEDHRQVILLREVEGMSYEEISQTLDIPRGTVESRIHRARLSLRKLLSGYETT